jgi:hypothetical protein
MAMEKGPEARHSVWPGAKAYMQYVECLAKHYNAAYGTFYDAINIACYNSDIHHHSHNQFDRGGFKPLSSGFN